MSVSRGRVTSAKMMMFASWLLMAVSACKDRPERRPAELAQRRAAEAKEVEAELAQQPEKSQPAAVPVAAPDRPGPGPGGPGGPPPTAAQLPVPEDFQPEAAATIMRANYLGELDKLETELRADEQ